MYQVIRGCAAGCTAGNGCMGAYVHALQQADPMSLTCGVPPKVFWSHHFIGLIFW